MTVIDLASRVVMHGSWIYLKDCRELGAATGEKGRTVEIFQLNGSGGRGRATLVLEVECKCGAFVAGRGHGFSGWRPLMRSQQQSSRRRFALLWPAPLPDATPSSIGSAATITLEEAGG